MKFLLLHILCILGYTLSLCTANETVNKSCTFVSDGYEASETGTCFHLSKEALAWQDAHRFCHLNQGWLMNSVHETSSYFDPNVLKFNGLLSFWSGYHVKNGRLLADNFPTVQSAGTFTNFTLNNITGSSLCVLQVYNGTCKGRPTVRQAQAGGGGTQCEDSYTKMFTPCDQRHFFVCMFQVKLDSTKGSVHYQGSTPTIRVETLPVDFYTTVESVPFYEIDATCKRTLQNGKPFRVTSDYERKMLLSYGNSSLSLDYIKDRTELLWLDAGEDIVCSAVAVGSSKFVQQEYTPLPCGTPLRVLCQLNKLYNDTPPPKLKITSHWPGVKVIGNEIQAPSRLARQFGSFSDANGTLIPNNVSIECVTSIGSLQAVTFFKNGIPLMSQDGMPPTVGHYFNLTVQENDFSVSGDSDIDLNQYFHCEVNNLKDGSILQSDFAFLRLTDYEIYSLHLDLVSNDMADKLSVAMLRATLLNQWTSQNGDASSRNLTLNPTLTVPRSLSSSLSDLQSSLDDVVKPLQGWRIKPKIFTTSPNDDRKSLVAYIYRKVSETQTIEDMSQTMFDLASQNITDLFQKRKKELPQFNAASVQVRSIDWCWPVNLGDTNTHAGYNLPKSTVGTVWKSPSTCAQDRQPLVTMACEGDKIIGLYWTRRVNPLCAYYSANNSERTNVTYWLQDIALANINSSNVEKIVNSTRRVILEMDMNRVIPEDVRYIADIFQKISYISVKTRATVQGMLDVAAFMRNFPDHVLTESQRLGNATNRILKSLDQLGGHVEIGTDQNYLRITSGGLGLEVWNLSRINDSTFVLGIKILSGDKTEVLTSENLRTVTKIDQVDFGQAEVAILLQTALINNIVSNYSGSNIRLAMNVYSDTTLFKNSVIENNISKPSLNSRVITAQLLVDNKAVSIRNSTTAQTMFLPVKQMPIHLRSNLTTCAFWNFEAESGAGGWSSQGCVYNQTIDGRDVCVCDHLTNFAVLTSFYDQERVDNENFLALLIVSCVGASLSVVGLSLSIFSFLFIKQLQKGRPQQTLFQLCLALLMAWVVFLASASQTSLDPGCIVVTVLFHYLILSSFMWMLMEGILQYLLFVKVMNTHFTNYMWKTSIPAWGLPVIPVVIVVIIFRDIYIGETKCCCMSELAFFYGVVIPVSLIIMTNTVIFIVVVVNLCRRKDMTKHSSLHQNKTAVDIRASFICSCVLGLFWIFGFLTIGNHARVIFHFIFCITATLQGAVIFVTMTARDKTVRDFWSSKLARIWILFTSLTKIGRYR